MSAAPLSIGLRTIAVALAGEFVGGPAIRLSTILAGWAGHPPPA